MDYMLSGPTDGALLVLAPGAGAGMASPWMSDFSERLAERGVGTARFEFKYLTARRTGTPGGGQPSAEAVTDEYRGAVAQLRAAHPARSLVIGGKSFGGRVASLVADALQVAGLVCLGYPFHPPEKPAQLRTAHLEHLQTPALICQGTRDPFGTKDDVGTYRLSPSIEVHWLEDGDHDLRPRKAISGRTYRQNLDEAADAVAAFATRVMP